MASTSLNAVKTVIKSLIISCPGEINIDQLNKDYRSVEGSYIPYECFGYKDLECFLRSIPETVQVFGHGSQASVKFIRNEKSDHIYEMVQRQKKDKKSYGKYGHLSRPIGNASKNKYLPEAQQKHFTKLQQKTINSDNQTLSYSKNPKSDSPLILEKRFQPFRSETSYLENISKVKRNKDNSVNQTSEGKESLINKNNVTRKIASETDLEPEFNTNSGTNILLKNNDKKNEKSYSLSEKSNIISEEKSDFFDRNFNHNSCHVNDLDTAIPEFAADRFVFQMDFPKNTIKAGEKIPDYIISKNLKCGSTIQLFVTEVHNPFKFWFHIHEENNEIDDLMNNMGSIYNNFQGSKYNISASCIKAGQVCAAFHNGYWHRAEILSDIRCSKVKCFFIDYGTVAEVQIENIKYLLNKFSNLPSQAMRGCLSSIKPNGPHWSMKATRHFISLVSDVMLYAQIREIDQENRVFYMVVCNTLGAETIQVNKDLVEKKYALLNSNWDPEKIKLTGYRNHHPREDYPTFSMIETGVYPSLSELIELKNKGIDYERIYDNLIYNHGNLSKRMDASEFIRQLPFGLLSSNPFSKDILQELNLVDKF